MTPFSALSAVLLAWLAALTTLISYRLLTGAIPLDGLLRSGRGHLAPERLQLLLVTTSALAAYATASLTQGRLLDLNDQIDPLLLSLFFGSHGIYLVGKAVRA
jgi:hypothetical protein